MQNNNHICPHVACEEGKKAPLSNKANITLGPNRTNLIYVPYILSLYLEVSFCFDSQIAPFHTAASRCDGGNSQIGKHGKKPQTNQDLNKGCL